MIHHWLGLDIDVSGLELWLTIMGAASVALLAASLLGGKEKT